MPLCPRLDWAVTAKALLLALKSESQLEPYPSVQGIAFPAPRVSPSQHAGYRLPSVQGITFPAPRASPSHGPCAYDGMNRSNTVASLPCHSKHTPAREKVIGIHGCL